MSSIQGKVPALMDDDYYPMHDLEDVTVHNLSTTESISAVSSIVIRGDSRMNTSSFMQRLLQSHIFEVNQYLKPKESMVNDNKGMMIDNGVTVTSARLNELLSVPRMYQDAINSRNIDSLRAIINEYMLENCLLKTPALTEPIEGRDYIFDMLDSVIRSTKNFHIQFNEVDISMGNKFIIACGSSEGVFTNRDASDYLWNHVAHRNENASYRDKIRTKMKRFFTSYIEDGIYSRGFAVKFFISNIIQFVVNSEGTHFESVIVSRKSFKLRLARTSDLNEI